MRPVYSRSGVKKRACAGKALFFWFHYTRKVGSAWWNDLVSPQANCPRPVNSQKQGRQISTVKQRSPSLSDMRGN
jgi:hypothetical protein